jgi:aerobic-type carbon monoxide dehydrogenase small subunit (CoxS/CutS family)
MTSASPNAQILVDGTPLAADPGAALTAVLVAAGRWVLRTHPLTGAPRGPLCGMGVCLECEVTVDGQPGTRACLTPVTDGMQVQTTAAVAAP